MTNNLYVEACLAMDRLVHHGEIHAVAVTDHTTRMPEIGPDKLQLLEQSYQDWMMVDDAVVQVLRSPSVKSKTACLQ
jgi:hypothetical protein